MSKIQDKLFKAASKDDVRVVSMSPNKKREPREGQSSTILGTNVASNYKILNSDTKK